MSSIQDITSTLAIAMATTAHDTTGVAHPTEANNKITTDVPYVFPWETMPYEIRERIFAEANKNPFPNQVSWRGKMSALVIALRPLPLSYSHVLEWLAHFSGHIFMHPNTWYGNDLSDWNATELRLIKSLDMDLWYLTLHCSVKFLDSSDINLIHDEKTQTWIPGFQKPTFMTSILAKATNLREVHLAIDLNERTSFTGAAQYITQWPLWLEGCSSLSSLTVEIPLPSSTSIYSPDWDRNFNGLLKRIAQKVGVHGQPIKEIGDPYYERREVWAWVAPAGTLMNWSQDIGREWHEPRDRASWVVNKKLSSIFDQLLDARLEERDGAFFLYGDDGYQSSGDW
ncbi:hypothetical protein VTL71DRAFT_6652 [Oculimacula yallundae]|uniref:Uncharacterized protein n=1 Tax=Oculimacula yallundae TaxID=86028 RepID=A0ABR4BZ42_9HELO